jgi:hypothetical protein
LLLVVVVEVMTAVVVQVLVDLGQLLLLLVVAVHLNLL